jgi:hypothetical protein
MTGIEIAVAFFLLSGVMSMSCGGIVYLWTQSALLDKRLRKTNEVKKLEPSVDTEDNKHGTSYRGASIAVPAVRVQHDPNSTEDG